MTLSPTARIPKRESPPWFGLRNEPIRIPCCECSQSVSGYRGTLLNFLPKEDGWLLTRDPDTGRIIAICPRCRERETTDTPGEEDV